MSSTAWDEGQGGRFGTKGVRTRGLPLAAIFNDFLVILKLVANYCFFKKFHLTCKKHC